MKIAFLIVWNIAALCAVFWYLRKRYAVEKSFRDFAAERRVYMICSCLLLVLVAGLEILAYSEVRVAYVEILIRWTTLLWGTYLLAYVDRKEKKIPNKVLLAMLLLRAALLVYEVLNNLEFWKAALLHPAAGAVAGSLLMLFAMLISRNGVGMGDVKLFFVVGLYVGGSEIVSVLFYSVLACAIAGIVLLITKKAGLKDTVPIAPFSFIGISVEFLFLMFGGRL